MSEVHGSRLGLLPAACLLLAGCAIDAAEEPSERHGEAEGAAVIDNGVVLNGVVLNGVVLNGVVLNSLNLHALSLNSLKAGALQPASLSSAARAAIEDAGTQGEQARQALRYVVECALPVNGSFDFSWTDAAGALRQESFPGALGLAPSWANSPASSADTGWVSACLLARANRYGASVGISMRGGHGVLAALNQAELDAYTHLEGSFFGDLFASPPTAHACSNPAELTYARDHQRDCATGTPREDGGVDGCGEIQMVGSCADLCTKYNNPKGYYSDCATTAGGPEASAVVTVYLE